ncbi:hypothetical protein JVT61DRAFT_3551 [Boletus reticuloceps]|uniref:Sacsin/Nov domain-containing protein n=1 Tax=Boletus reticuloceps TaxID=495285 RepID=A0A8I3A813_9AGAM|nr:hypothetical protein JVT61DRAFT_3551 [Boletus reticuloceps]
MLEDSEELWRTGKDQPVEVNQRALIDKVLARYSGEFTLFRELLQNSDDAQSHTVEIHFETAAYLDRRKRREETLSVSALPDLKSTPVTQWTFRNNGEVFTEKDWMRLPKIAEGNPRPEKIGAFGVGFYSLFSVTESPFVSSGGHGMQFYWKDNDQLYVRRGNLPKRETPSPWTTFELPLREASPIPPPLEFMRFLASSITFMVNLRELGVFFDEHCIGCIKKFPGTIQPVAVPGELKRSSPLNIMNVIELQYHRESDLCLCHVGANECTGSAITIEVEVLPAVDTTGAEKLLSQGGSESQDEICSSPSSQQSQLGTLTPPQQHGDPTRRLHRTKADLTVFTAEVKVELDQKLSMELLRSTKKRSPTRLKYCLIYTGKEEYDRSVADQHDPTSMCGSVFQGLRADLNGLVDLISIMSIMTDLFLGHATGQTTGIGGHMASYFIPTVERESIDLVDRNIASERSLSNDLETCLYIIGLAWNEELLYVGGFLSRTLYDLELSKIRDAWEGAAGSSGTPEFLPSAELQETLRQRFLHVLKFFTFHISTPLSKVARLLEVAFYGCSTVPLRLLSSTGVRSAPEIKECNLAVAMFLKYLPMLPHYVIQECPRAVEALLAQHKISPITLSDILQDLRTHVLTQEELIACLRWWMSRKNVSPQDTTRLLSAITIHSANGSPLQLSSVEYFVGSKSLKACIPLDGPLPTSLMSHDITTRFTPTALMSFGWQEFTTVDWLRHISQTEIMSANPDHDFTRSVQWAEHILGILSGVWSPLSDKLHRLAKSVFKGKSCIPTSHGLCSPDESFLSSPNITLFQDLDLPIVHFTAGLEIQGEMEGFLLSIGVRKHVPPQLLLDKMVETGNWSIPDLVGYLVQVQDTLTPDEFSRLESFVGFAEEGAQGDSDRRHRYRALDVLYPPLDIFRQLRLPVIDWSERWQNESDQAVLLYRLGLCRYPPLEKIVMLSSAAPDVTVRETAFKYLCDNLLSKYSHYNPDNFRHITFIPAESKDGACLAKPGDVRGFSPSVSPSHVLSQVFLSNRWKALGFSVIQDSYRKAPVAELGAQQHPPPSTLIQLLETTPPTNRETARQWFECLCECISNFSQLELARLSELPIVPTRSSTGWQQMAPAQCYLNEGTRDDFHTKLFVFVDFGSTANRFLRACGSKSEPSVKDVAESLVEDPKRFYDLAGGHEDFLAELRDLASQSRRIPNITLSKMMSRPILLGIRRKRALDGVEYEYERALRKPEEIVIADDMNSYQVFTDTIFVAPQDVPGLEDFYLSLGCRRLSTVVEETYNASNEIRDPKTSTEVRTLIFERLPLFLRGYAHTEFKVPVSLLRDENFKVKICERLLVSNTLTIGDDRMPRSQNVWAATNRDEEGRIELWLNNAELDMHEIAASLCRLLFGTARVNDTLLLATILSTPLEILKRRGYDVGKISKQHGQQPEDSDLAEEATDSHHVPPVVTTTPPPNDVPDQPEVMVGPGIAAASAKPSTNRRTPGASEVPSGNTPSPAPLHRSVERASNAPNNARSPIPNLIHRLILRGRASETIPSATSPRYPRTPRQVIPQSYIRANVNKAMNVCKPAGGKLLHHHNKVEDVRDFPNTGYCDVSGQVEQMKLRGELLAYCHVPDADTFMNAMHDVLTRFVDVLTPVAELYDLPLTLLHVFYDVAGGPIAFNRDRSIFLNLRYFEAWHDQDVQNGGPEQAQISWYVLFSHLLLSSSIDKRVKSRFFTLAHELAHNLIKEHNSEHVFWFAAICEAHVWKALARTSI